MPEAGLSGRRSVAPRSTKSRAEVPGAGASSTPHRAATPGGGAPSTPPRGAVPGAGVPGRRTVRIQGRGAERHLPPSRRGRPTRRAHERVGFKPDRAAMWAVLLGILLVLVAAASAHAAVTGGHASAVAHALAVSH
jgi:hypothetical protein